MTNTENKFEYCGLIYIAVEAEGCKLCDFDEEGKCSAMESINVPLCDARGRIDKRNVVFVLSDIDNKGKYQ